MRKLQTFEREADLCAAFISALPADWTAYPETADFDILLARKDGRQIGVEAKLRLNPEVLLQATERYDQWDACAPGPDFRAALVPHGRVQVGMSELARRLGVTVITMMTEAQREESHRWPRKQLFWPALPTQRMDDYWGDHERDWLDWCPDARITLPDYVPDVSAGCSAPVKLSPWKIGAIKLSILLDRRGYLTRADFKHFRIDATRWTRDWLDRGASRGCYVRGARTPDFKSQHPVNWAQIEADFDRWKPADASAPMPPVQHPLFSEAAE